MCACAHAICLLRRLWRRLCGLRCMVASFGHKLVLQVWFLCVFHSRRLRERNAGVVWMCWVSYSSSACSGWLPSVMGALSCSSPQRCRPKEAVGLVWERGGMARWFTCVSCPHWCSLAYLVAVWAACGYTSCLFRARVSFATVACTLLVCGSLCPFYHALVRGDDGLRSVRGMEG